MWRAAGTVFLGAALALTAATFGSPSLYVPGFALALIGLTAIAWVLIAARGATLTREVGPASVEEEHGWPLDLIARTGALPAPGGELAEPLLKQPLPMIGRRARRVRVNVTFARRGRRQVGPARLVIRDPFGLVEREVQAGEGQQVLVLPRVEPVVAGGGRGAGGTPLGAIGSRPAEAAAEIELESLRPYREGTPASRIHWPTVARSGALMERRLLADSDSRPLVVLDPSRPASEEALDAAVRAAASLCVHLARSGGCALLLPGDRRATDIQPDLGAWHSLHARLALVGPDHGAPVVNLDARRGAIFWVSATDGAQPPRILGRLAPDRWLVTPGSMPGRAAFTVAGCAGRTIGRSRARSAA